MQLALMLGEQWLTLRISIRTKEDSANKQENNEHSCSDQMTE
jgi:hypothetical protein